LAKGGASASLTLPLVAPLIIVFLIINQEQLRLKILKKLRTTSLKSKFIGSDKNISVGN